VSFAPWSGARDRDLRLVGGCDHRRPSFEDPCKRLEDAGADVVGLNCSRGPATLIPLLERVRAAVSCPVAAQPVPYRTSAEQPTFQSLRDRNGGRAFPIALDPFTCTRFEMADFATAARDLGVGAAEIAKADVVCLPSLKEPQGQAMLEALARGRPVVATRVGGPAEVITPRIGALVDPLDVDSIAAGMLAAAALPVPSPEAVRAAAEHALPNQAAKIEAVLARAAIGRPPSASRSTRREPGKLAILP